MDGGRGVEVRGMEDEWMRHAGEDESRRIPLPFGTQGPNWCGTLFLVFPAHHDPNDFGCMAGDSTLRFLGWLSGGPYGAVC